MNATPPNMGIATGDKLLVGTQSRDSGTYVKGVVQCEPSCRHNTEGIAKMASEKQLVREPRYRRSFPLDDPQVVKLTGKRRIHMQSDGLGVAEKT